jgi:hypothetical protein
MGKESGIKNSHTALVLGKYSDFPEYLQKSVNSVSGIGIIKIYPYNPGRNIT